MNPNAFKLLAASISVALLSVQASSAKQEPAPAFEPTLPWLSDLDAAIAASEKSGKPILAEFR